MKFRLIHITILFTVVTLVSEAQISPGDLSTAHSELEGMANCTKCHVLGGKVTNEKCLECHKELKIRIDQKKGYHVSAEVNNKNCASCHSDHHGRNFAMIRFKEDEFQHQLTGYTLSGKHNKIDCRECHKPDYIQNTELKKNPKTFLGLGQECLSCHEDQHQKTLPSDCAGCHSTEAFSPSKFDHNKADFVLVGKHREVSCAKCHKMEKRNGKDFQRFNDIPFENCTSCHKDVHEGKFGTKCTECHSEASFSVAGASKGFNHDMTGFELTGKHRNVDCKQCHLSGFTNPIPHNKCSSCHQDYHKGEFVKNSVKPDCAECHTVNGFSNSQFTIEKHNVSKFPLEGAHLATPCFACHKQDSRWSFRVNGEKCVNCHKDVHLGYINEQYYPNQSCESCHTSNRWQENHFNHDLTKFKLSGAHANQNCMACHKSDNSLEGHRYDKFQNLSSSCVSCHEDVHHKQFEKNGLTQCQECHKFENWNSTDFDHNKTAFPLDGKHILVDCTECHKKTETQGEVYVLYKIKKFRCIDCHL